MSGERDDLSSFNLFYRNNFNQVDPPSSRSEFIENVKMGRGNKLAKQAVRYAYGILSIATRRILVNLVVHIIRRIVQGVIHMLRRR